MHGDDPAPPLRAFLAEHRPDDAPPLRAVWAGVNPAGAAALLAAWPTDVAPPPTELPRDTLDRLIDNATREPARVGTDRLLNALAVAALAPPSLFATGAPAFAAVADCGTATTIDTVRLRPGRGNAGRGNAGRGNAGRGNAGRGNAGTRPEFLGGAILPGATLCVKALHAHTALLPAVDLWDGGPADGRDTAAAIRLGALEMQAAVVDRLLGGGNEAGGGNESGGGNQRPAFQVLTGGAANLIADRLRTCEPHLAPDLTLIGLAIAANEAPDL